MRRLTTALAAMLAFASIPAQAASTVVFRDDFTTLNKIVWNVYDGINPATGECWSPTAWTVSGGVLTGTSGGGSRSIPGAAMASNRTYGDWQVRARFPATQSRKLNPVFLLWPANDADWPAAGEVDFTENYDPARTTTEGWLHYSASNNTTYAWTHVDMTVWHVYEAQWTPTTVTYLIDGHTWFRDTTPSHIPTGPMHLALQMDDTETALPHPLTTFQVDWVQIRP